MAHDPAGQVRTRRDFRQLLTAVQAIALLYQCQRERRDDRVIATLDDYARAYSLLASVFAAVAAFAARAVLHADEMTAADVDTLREHGLDDAEVFDVVLAATARVFWSRTNDAIGYTPSAAYLGKSLALLGEPLFAALMVGRQYGPGAAPDD